MTYEVYRRSIRFPSFFSVITWAIIVAELLKVSKITTKKIKKTYVV